MKEMPDRTPEVVNLAHEIIDLWHIAQMYQEMKQERDYWKSEYIKLLNNDIDKGKKTIAMILNKLLDIQEKA